jgi:hypothetical protein
MTITWSGVERPIIFSGAMVRAILEGRKTHTRRVVKPQPEGPFSLWPNDDSHLEWSDVVTNTDYYVACGLCPYGKPGDRLWVRETFNVGWLDGGKVLYRADGGSAKEAGYPSEPVYKPSIHMPRWASRLTLEIASVKVERVQDISEADAIAEGVETDKHGCTFYAPGVLYTDISGQQARGIKPFRRAKQAFEDLWESINRDREGCSWYENPWVWVIEFRRAEAHVS